MALRRALPYTIHRPLAWVGMIRAFGPRRRCWTRGSTKYLLNAIATHRVADRRDRYEPRVKKERRNHHGWLTKPRAEMKRKMAKGVAKI